MVKEDKLLSMIRPLIENKIVLDVGCVEHSLRRKNVERIWVHDFLCKYGEKVIGIDISKPDIEQLKKEGYKVYVQNAETFSLPDKFDVIFAGELIEHLDNPGLFLIQCRKLNYSPKTGQCNKVKFGLP